jgi:hypothetical protein
MSGTRSTETEISWRLHEIWRFHPNGFTEGIKMKFTEMTGKKFGKLTVLRNDGRNRHGFIFWLCLCDCGREVSVDGYLLRIGKTKSCGCIHKSMITKHGHSSEPEYYAWKGMIRRCTNPEDGGFKNYGGRGIKVCERWLCLENFLEDMGKKPFPFSSIDRINNDKGYEPNNCRWATLEQQALNKRSNLKLTHDEKTLTITEWARELGIERMTLFARVYRGWSVDQCLETPIQKQFSRKVMRTKKCA